MFSVLLFNIFPLYIIIALGFIAGKKLSVQLEGTANLAIFILTPVVIFGALTKTRFETEYLLLPIIIFTAGSLCALTAYFLAKKRYKDVTPNLLGMACGTGNTGYFGLPVMLSLFGDALAGVYLLMNFGIILFENTLGYFLGARGHVDTKTALKKIIRLPALHATWLGILISLFEVQETRLMTIFYIYWQYFYGAWIVIGMMLIGIALSKVQKFRINPELLGWFFGFKFLVWPLVMLAIVTIDKSALHLFDERIHILMMLISSVPLASNVVAFAAHLNLRPSEAATAVLLSTIFALFFIPLVIGHLM